MKTSTKLQVKMSEARQRLNTLAGLDELTDEQRSEMNRIGAELPGLEEQYRAAVTAEDDSETRTEPENRASEDYTDEERERRSIANRAGVAGYVRSALEVRSLDGAEKELNESLGLSAESGRMPLFMLLPPEDRTEDGGRIEYRADAATALVASNVQRNVAWLARVFQESVAADLGVAMEMADPGQQTYTTLTAGVSAEAVAKGAAKDAEQANVGVKTLEPGRIAARYLFSIEDENRLVGLENALTMDLGEAIRDQRDKVIVDYLLANAPVSGADDPLSAQTSLQGFVELIAGVLDGVYARTMNDLRVGVGVAMYRRLVTIFQDGDGNVPDGLTAVVDFLSSSDMAHRVSRLVSTSHIPDISGNTGEQYAVVTKGKGLARAAVSVVWPTMLIVRDPYTHAATGQIAITGTVLHDVDINRAANFARVRLQHAA